MIKAKDELLEYLRADKIALERKRRRPHPLDYVWRFQRLLRYAEYIHNCRRSRLWRPLAKVVNWRLQRMKVRLGFSIPLNVFGPGLSIAHYGTIVVNKGATVGSNCRLHSCVNIGTEAGKEFEAPDIGNDVYIGPGVKIFGRITIADRIAIGANAVVNKSFSTPNVTIAGVPAREISQKGAPHLASREKQNDDGNEY